MRIWLFYILTAPLFLWMKLLPIPHIYDENWPAWKKKWFGKDQSLGASRAEYVWMACFFMLLIWGGYKLF